MFLKSYNERIDTNANIIILSSCRQTIGLTGKGFVLRRARLFEEDRLKITGRDGFAVVPAYFERPDTHLWTRFLVVKDNERGEQSEWPDGHLSSRGRGTERAVLRDLITINYIALRLESTPP